MSTDKIGEFSDETILFPKLLVLVSKYPIYTEMSNWLNQLYKNVTNEKEGCKYTIESMLANLIYTFPHPDRLLRVGTPFWEGSKHKEKEYFVYEYDENMNQPYCNKYNYPIFAEIFHSNCDKDETNMWSIFENMLSCFPIILISKYPSKLCAVIEVFKTLMYPFEYQGIVVPFDPEPNLTLLMSNQPYVVGMKQSSYEKIKNLPD